MPDGKVYAMIVSLYSNSEANMRLIGLSVELRDTGVKDLTLAKIFCQYTALCNRNTSYDRSNIWIVNPDANKFRPQEMREDWEESRVELETLGKKDSITHAVVDTLMMQLEGANQGSLDGDIKAEQASNNPHWFQGKSQSVQFGSTLVMTGTCGSINLHLISRQSHTSGSFKDLQQHILHTQVNLNAANHKVKELQDQLALLQHG